MNLPSDIQNFIDKSFTIPSEKEEVQQLLFSLWSRALNVGPEQLARSILVLSNGSIFELKDIFDSKFFGDPRDVLMRAEAKAGNPGHYFLTEL